MGHLGGWGTWVIGTWNFRDPMILWGSMKNSKKMSKCQKDVKMSKRCQNVKEMSNVKKSNTQTMEEVHKKNKLT